MRVVDLPPVAPTLFEAMRAVGYSFETAVADIIDNSITAKATDVDVFFMPYGEPYGEPYVAILDNGLGMSAEQLRIAMRHGSRDPLLDTEEGDLGRFGLGMKTASLSQCRSLTVVSARSGGLAGARWDLDEVIRHGSWALLELDEDDLESVPEISNLKERHTGTLVVWEKLDRVFAGEASHDRALQNRIDDTRSHLGLVFHRFLESSLTQRPFSIALNNAPVSPSDPYLRGSKGSQLLPVETITVDGHKVEIQAHILPHISRLSQAEIERAGGEEGLRKNQGFYVYRNRRLIIWGTWFRLAKQEEMTKLARVMVDVPNALDHFWTLDIKKSTAHPPEVVRNGLRRIVERIADRSRRVYTYRGVKLTDRAVIHAWERIEHRGGLITYRVNREHDLFNAIRSIVPEDKGRLLERFLQVLEQSFPFDALYADMAGERRVSEEVDTEELEDSLLETAQLMIDALGRDSEPAKTLKSRLHLLDPFSRHPEITERIRERIS